MSLPVDLPRYPLAFLPTPLHPLPRLSQMLTASAAPALHGSAPDLKIWIKRDDQTGLAGGGNKTRKLELLLADALAQDCDTLLTTGAVQSNHCRQTAAAAARAGLGCELVLGGQPPTHPFPLTGGYGGNFLLDILFGARLHWTTRENRLNRLGELAEELRAAGRRPYFITYGGSDPVGASGYALAMHELYCQTSALGLRLDAIVVASSSGGTQAGMIAGARALDWAVPILGISIDEQKADLQAKVADLATRTAAHLGRADVFTPAEVWVDDGYLGDGYGVVGDLERDAIGAMARHEGILLDPVYTGRAFGGVMDMLRTGSDRLAKPLGAGPTNILFWHTGGQPAIFAYAEDLL